MASHCTYIYRDPKTDVVRYIGEGQQHRPKNHLKSSQCLLLGRMLAKRQAEGYIVRPTVIEAASKADDGIKIYASRLELIVELGHGKAGKAHPNFRYV